MTAEHSVTTPLPDTGLMLVGMGPGRLSGMSLEALNAAKTADVRRYEAYTALWPQAELDALEAYIVAPLSIFGCLLPISLPLPPSVTP